MKKLFFFPLFIFLLPAAFCQKPTSKIDSLLNLLKTDKPDTNKVTHLFKLCSEFENIGLYDTAIQYGNCALQLAQQLNFKKGIADSYSNIGIVYYYQGNYSKTIEDWLQALKIDEEQKNKKGMATHLGNIGIVYNEQGDYSKALEYYFKALKMAEDIGYKKLQAGNLSNIGSVYYIQGDYLKALEYDFKALEIDKNKESTATELGNIGIVYLKKGDYLKALEYTHKALKIDEELKNKEGIAEELTSIGGIYQLKKNLPQALDYYSKSLKMAEEMGYKQLQATNLSNIGTLYITTGKFKAAEQYLKRAITTNESIGTLNGLLNVEESLSQLYDTTGRFKEALIHYKKAIALKDTLFSQENKKQLVRKEMKFEFDKKEAITKAENEKQQAIAEEKSRKQKIIIWSVAFGLLLVVVFAGFIFRSLRITRKQKNIIELQKNEVSKQKDIADSQRIIAEELREISEKQKHIVEEKQKEIVDSITYARRIQRALLTSDEYIKNNLPAEHFILFKPKDIVSGDFYWALRTPPSGEKGKGLFYIATADCTGHGVPGAFMSMLNISYLNENVIERGISLPHNILDAQRTEIIKALNPSGSTEVSKDGMDCILCVYDFDKMLLHFASANNPLWLVRNGELIEYKADKMPVGKYIEDMHPFTLQTIELQKDDIIYTSTDGFADQFGTNNKKLMKKTFKEELLKIHLHPMSEQKEYLNHFFENWKGNTQQIDDVCVIGIRI